MADLAQIARIRERFIEDPETDLSGIRPVIARSWRRSAAACVDPSVRRELIEDARVDEQTLRIASPILTELSQIATDVGGYVTLVAATGNMVKEPSTGYDGIPHGYVLREDHCGTNGDGTALEEGRSMWVHSREHYSDDMQDACCFSVLVRDPFRQNVRACIGLTLPESVAIATDPRSTALLLEGYAARVTRELAARTATREQALFGEYLRATRQHVKSAILAVDGKTHIVNDLALSLLGEADYAVISSYAHDALRARHTVRHEVILSGDRTLRLDITPAGEPADPVGAIVLVRPAPEDVARPSRTAGPRREAGPAYPEASHLATEGLIGSSTSFQSAIRLAGTAIERRASVHLIGEAGVGKHELAARIAHGFGPRVTIVDCHGPGSGGAVEAARQAVGDGATILLRRADMLPAGAGAAMAALFQEREHAPVVLTLRRPTSAVAPLLAALGSSEIAIAPLRVRRDDIPPLVRHFAAEVTDKPPSTRLLAALTQADWPGNVPQLRTVVRDAAATATGRQVSLGDLPQAFQRAAAQGRLSRLEEAEMHELRNALEEANGNRSLAADILQIGRSTLYRRLGSYARRGIAI